jgi:hypothetical protein
MRHQNEALFRCYWVDAPILSHRQIFSSVRFCGSQVQAVSWVRNMHDCIIGRALGEYYWTVDTAIVEVTVWSKSTETPRLWKFCEVFWIRVNAALLTGPFSGRRSYPGREKQTNLPGPEWLKFGIGSCSDAWFLVSWSGCEFRCFVESTQESAAANRDPEQYELLDVQPDRCYPRMPISKVFVENPISSPLHWSKLEYSVSVRRHHEHG